MQVIVGGQEPTLDHWLPLFAHISSRLYYAGSTGNAAKMKALHQVAAATNHLASFEVICAGLEAGFDGQVS